MQGFAYVSYNSVEAAALAVEHLNGIEFPPNSGQRMKARTPLFLKKTLH